MGYVVPAAWISVSNLLKQHGIRYETIQREINGEFVWSKFQNPQFTPQPFEGRFLVRSF